MADSDATPTFEAYPLTRNEYITALVHFYRGEMHRAQSWRSRLDTTTNWALATTGAMLSFAFSAPEHSPVTLLLTDLLVIMFLTFEARRFRYFDVWRARVRMLEENFFIPIIRRNLVSPRTNWREWVAEDLDQPKFKISFWQAAGIRLERNYFWIFIIIFLAWLAKLDLHPSKAKSFAEVVSRMAVGPFPGALVLVLMSGFLLATAALVAWTQRQPGCVDEIHGVERARDHWKF